jgi:hypothetical protein
MVQYFLGQFYKEKYQNASARVMDYKSRSSENEK